MLFVTLLFLFEACLNRSKRATKKTKAKHERAAPDEGAALHFAVCTTNLSRRQRLLLRKSHILAFDGRKVNCFSAKRRRPIQWRARSAGIAHARRRRRGTRRQGLPRRRRRGEGRRRRGLNFRFNHGYGPGFYGATRVAFRLATAGCKQDSQCRKRGDD